MTDNKDELKSQERIEELRSFLKHSSDLQESGKLTQDEEDELDEKLGEMMRKFSVCRDKNTIINPERYKDLALIYNTLLKMGFSDNEVEFEVKPFTMCGYVSVCAPELDFDADELGELYTILSKSSAVGALSRSNGNIEMSFTIPNVLKELE